MTETKRWEIAIYNAGLVWSFTIGWFLTPPYLIILCLFPDMALKWPPIIPTIIAVNLIIFLVTVWLRLRLKDREDGDFGMLGNQVY